MDFVRLQELPRLSVVQEASHRSRSAFVGSKQLYAIDTTGQGKIGGLCFNPVSPQLCSIAGSFVYLNSIFDQRADQYKSFNKNKMGATCCAYRGDGKLLAAGDASGTTYLLDPLETKGLVRKLRGPAGVQPLDVCFSVTSRTEVWTSCTDSSVRLWDIATGSTTGMHRLFDNGGVGLTRCDSAGSLFVSAHSRSPSVVMWDARSSSSVLPIARSESGSAGCIVGVEFIGGADAMFVVASENGLSLHDVRSPGAVLGRGVHPTGHLSVLVDMKIANKNGAGECSVITADKSGIVKSVPLDSLWSTATETVDVATGDASALTPRAVTSTVSGSLTGSSGKGGARLVCDLNACITKIAIGKSAEASDILAVGTETGAVHVFRAKKPMVPVAGGLKGALGNLLCQGASDPLSNVTYGKYYVQSMRAGAGVKDGQRPGSLAAASAASADATVSKIDYMLKKFDYPMLVDHVTSVSSVTVNTGVSVIDELIQRGALLAAVRSKSTSQLDSIFRFLTKIVNNGDPCHMSVVDYFVEMLETSLNLALRRNREPDLTGSSFGSKRRRITPSGEHSHEWTNSSSHFRFASDTTDEGTPRSEMEDESDADNDGDWSDSSLEEYANRLEAARRISGKSEPVVVPAVKPVKAFLSSINEQVSCSLKCCKLLGIVDSIFDNISASVRKPSVAPHDTFRYPVEFQ